MNQSSNCVVSPTSINTSGHVSCASIKPGNSTHPSGVSASNLPLSSLVACITGLPVMAPGYGREVTK